MPRVPTEQQDDAGQDGDEGAHAEPDGQHVGLHVAGLDDAVAAAAAHADGQGAGAAHGRRAAVADDDGQQVHLLLLPAEPAVLGQDAQGVICKGKIGSVSAHRGAAEPTALPRCVQEASTQTFRSLSLCQQHVAQKCLPFLSSCLKKCNICIFSCKRMMMAVPHFPSAYIPTDIFPL